MACDPKEGQTKEREREREREEERESKSAACVREYGRKRWKWPISHHGSIRLGEIMFQPA